MKPSKQVCWEIGEVTDTEGEGRDGRGGQGKVAVIVHLQCSCLGTTSQEKTPANLKLITLKAFTGKSSWFHDVLTFETFA